MTTTCLRCIQQQQPIPYRWQWFALTVDGRTRNYLIPCAHALLRAKELSGYKPQTVTLNWHDLQSVVSINSIDPDHVAHLPADTLSLPGLAVQIPTVGGIRTYIIDGSHRAARCLQERKDFQVILFDDEEAAAIELPPPHSIDPACIVPNCPMCQRLIAPQTSYQQDALTYIAPDTSYLWYMPFAEMLLRFLKLRGYDDSPRMITPHELAQAPWLDRVSPAHVAHIPFDALSKPGIVAFVDTPYGYDAVLIDGRHRAARCLQEGIPFPVVTLPLPSSQAAILAINGVYQY